MFGLPAKPTRITAAVVASGLALIASVTLVWAFAEEPLGWRDPATGVTYDAVDVSTVHDDMTYVLALAAGFDITRAKILQTWAQLRIRSAPISRCAQFMHSWQHAAWLTTAAIRRSI